MHIKDSFVVVGSKKSGRVTLLVDKYAKGHIHIQKLRVDVNGIHYDVVP